MRYLSTYVTFIICAWFGWFGWFGWLNGTGTGKICGSSKWPFVRVRGGGGGGKFAGRGGRKEGMNEQFATD